MTSTPTIIVSGHFGAGANTLVEIIAAALNKEGYGESVEIDAGTARQEISCLDCDESWTDQYRLTGYNPTEY